MDGVEFEVCCNKKYMDSSKINCKFIRHSVLVRDFVPVSVAVCHWNVNGTLKKYKSNENGTSQRSDIKFSDKNYLYHYL